MKKNSVPQTSIDSEYIYNLPIDVSTLTFLWVDDKGENLYRKFSSNLNDDSDGTEERKWILPTKQTIEDSDVARFIINNAHKCNKPQLIIEYYSGKKDIVNIGA